MPTGTRGILQFDTLDATGDKPEVLDKTKNRNGSNTGNDAVPYKDFSSEPLFPDGGPRLEDIRQGSLGDCWLLAPLAAIVRANPDRVHQIIRDDGANARVTFYRAANKSFQKTEYLISKELPVRAGDDGALYAKGALWVNLIEKAYAIFERDNRQLQSAARYQFIEGGDPSDAFRTLLGESAEDWGVATKGPMGTGQGSRLDKGIYKFIEEHESEVERYVEDKKRAGQGGQNPVPNYRPVIRYDDWVEYLERYKDGKKIVFEENLVFRDEMKLVDAGSGDPSVESDLLGKIREMYPAKRKAHLVGRQVAYTEAQDHAFEKIRKALRQNKPVAVTTREHVGRFEQGKGHSGGESKSKGLVGGHAYAVLDTEIDAHGVAWVEIYNPWNFYARNYHDGKAMAYDKKDGKVSLGEEESDYRKKEAELKKAEDDVTKALQELDAITAEIEDYGKRRKQLTERNLELSKEKTTIEKTIRDLQRKIGSGDTEIERDKVIQQYAASQLPGKLLMVFRIELLMEEESKLEELKAIPQRLKRLIDQFTASGYYAKENEKKTKWQSAKNERERRAVALEKARLNIAENPLKHGKFKLELSDFTKRFDGVSAGGVIDR